MATSDSDFKVQMWKVKKLIKQLEAARGNGTSMISLIIRPKDQMSRIVQKLQEEYGTASNIKSRVNRLSVLNAITSAQGKLKQISKVPSNGLVVYCGTVITEEGKEKKVNIDIVPFRPINTTLYMCDNRFHTEALNELLIDDDKFGFVVMDGNGCLFGSLCGNTREILHKFTVDLPKKHGRGGQSALRFARLRLEKRHNYIRKVAETSKQIFITNDVPNVAGLIIAGSAGFKNELAQSDLLDPRLKSKILEVTDVSYGGENGFNQAIDNCAELLSGVKFMEEVKLISRYFSEISQDTGKYCYGYKDTLASMESGAVDVLIVWENLPINRLEAKNPETQEIQFLYLTPEQEKDTENFKDPHTGQMLEVVRSIPLVEWFADHYQETCGSMEIVTDKSQEGAQFVQGFGGVGAILRYKVDLQEMNPLEEFDELAEYEDYL
ncbi:hypothetical protein Zmor_004284 [Zophobas morio]|uniref:Eukaryotic peptide chain release factor subunit 1 n=1 Tax=Zophobas morio TaxID=2755281 RepID=A0AA38HI56_9CUCU|nr:hypothetical protein Zmor_004284 [Zophobas morio]